MARVVITVPSVTIPAIPGCPAQTLKKGDVIEATAAQISTLGAAARAASTTAGTGACGNRDTMGTAYAASNSTP